MICMTIFFIIYTNLFNHLSLNIVFDAANTPNSKRDISIKFQKQLVLFCNIVQCWFYKKLAKPNPTLFLYRSKNFNDGSINITL